MCRIYMIRTLRKQFPLLDKFLAVRMPCSRMAVTLFNVCLFEKRVNAFNNVVTMTGCDEGN